MSSNAAKYRCLMAYPLPNELATDNNFSIVGFRVSPGKGLYVEEVDAQSQRNTVIWVNGSRIIKLLDFNHSQNFFSGLNVNSAGYAFCLTHRREGIKTVGFLRLDRSKLPSIRFELERNDYGLRYYPERRVVLIASVSPGRIDLEEVGLTDRRSISSINTGNLIVTGVFPGQGPELEALVRFSPDSRSVGYYLSEADLLGRPGAKTDILEATPLGWPFITPRLTSGLVFGGRYTEQGIYQPAVWDSHDQTTLVMQESKGSTVFLSDVRRTEAGWLACGSAIIPEDKLAVAAITFDSCHQLVNLTNDAGIPGLELSNALAFAPEGIIYSLGKFNGRRGVVALIPV